jgi:hypothetical protein
MSDKKKVTLSLSTPLCTILFIIFLLSKVFETGLAKDWSWWWIFSPLWIPLALVLGVFISIVVFALFLKAFVYLLDRPKRRRNLNSFDALNKYRQKWVR